MVFKKLDSRYEQIIGMLNSMDKKADTFCFPTSQLLRLTSSKRK